MAAPLNSNDGDTTTVGRPSQRRSTGAALSLAAVAVLILGVGYYAYTTRSAFESRVAALDNSYNARFADEIYGIQQDTAALTTNVAAVTKGLEEVTRETESAREFARSLKRAQDTTARAVAAQTADVSAIRQDVATLAMDTSARLADVATEAKGALDAVEGARNDVADNRRQIAAMQTSLEERIVSNTQAVAELQRLGERESFEFDISKSSAPADTTVAGIRIRLTRTDVRKGKYNMVLHVDDREIEKKDRTLGEPVQFLVGPERQRYELVVTDVGRDRIRGYLMVSRAGTITTRQVAGR
jgi:hypothetical protein